MIAEAKRSGSKRWEWGKQRRKYVVQASPSVWKKISLAKLRQANDAKREQER
jgi:hypothetical protein